MSKKLLIILVSIFSLLSCSEEDGDSYNQPNEVQEVRIEEDVIVLCSDRGRDDILFFGLDDNFNKKNIYSNKYDSVILYTGDNYNAYFNIHEIEENYLLVECYEYSELKYKAIFHMTLNEYWNKWSYYGSTVVYGSQKPRFRVSYLTDLFFRGYKYYFSLGYSFEDSKIKSEAVIKNYFPYYPVEELGFHSTRDIGSGLIENYLKKIDERIDEIKSKTNYSTEYIINQIENYIFLNDQNINQLIKNELPLDS